VPAGGYSRVSQGVLLVCYLCELGRLRVKVDGPAVGVIRIRRSICMIQIVGFHLNPIDHYSIDSDQQQRPR